MLEQDMIDIYTSILHEELVPAMGCTEPIAIAYAGAILREALEIGRASCRERVSSPV